MPAVARHLQLVAEVAKVEHRIPAAVTGVGQRQRNVVAKKFPPRDTPSVRRSIENEKALARRDEQMPAHKFLPSINC
jgi:hypothetical protein